MDDVCRRVGVSPLPTGPEDMLGASREVRSGGWPIHGVRFRPAGGTCGWHVWSGPSLSRDPDYFVALHVAHMVEDRPEIEPYLGLPPGWRFLLAPGHEDVWFDEAVLEAE